MGILCNRTEQLIDKIVSNPDNVRWVRLDVTPEFSLKMGRLFVGPHYNICLTVSLSNPDGPLKYIDGKQGILELLDKLDISNKKTKYIAMKIYKGIVGYTDAKYMIEIKKKIAEMYEDIALLVELDIDVDGGFGNERYL